jgi:hypothetical protein
MRVGSSWSVRSFIGMCRAVHLVIPTMMVASGLSMAMLYEVQRIGTESQPYRGRVSRVIMAVGGLILLAHAVRVLGFMLMNRLGLVALAGR